MIHLDLGHEALSIKTRPSHVAAQHPEDHAAAELQRQALGLTVLRGTFNGVGAGSEAKKG